MPEKISHWCLLISVGLASVGCRPTSKKEYPVIYDAWNARYQYNPLTREMQPFVDDKSIGRAWSRDEFGRLNSMYFFSGVNGRDEDLLQVHKKKLDKKRDKQWESERETKYEPGWEPEWDPGSKRAWESERESEYEPGWKPK